MSKSVLGLALLAIVLSAAALTEVFLVMQQLNEQSRKVDQISSLLNDLSSQLTTLATKPPTGTKTIYMEILPDVGKEGYDKFFPQTIIVQKGDSVKLVIMNTDEVDHGFAIDAYGINKPIKSLETVTIEFVADKPGIFEFYCSIPCGEGHSEMTGQLIVLS